MQVFQTVGVPPSKGRSILAIIGCTQNKSSALTNKVVENSGNMFELIGWAAPRPTQTQCRSVVAAKA
jgi:hypothetical protein